MAKYDTRASFSRQSLLSFQANKIFIALGVRFVEIGYLFLLLFLIAAALLLAGLAPWQENPQHPAAPLQKQSSQRAIALETSGNAAEGMEVFATSPCGEASIKLYLDGTIAGEEMGARATFALSPLAAGEHALSATSGECSGSLEFSVAAPACNAGETEECGIGACKGLRKCENGAFTECMLPKKMCVPGSATGCLLDSCSFGYSKCNECGTGYGPCMPSPQTGGSLISCPT
jgi:hypothetical protein